MSSISCPQFGQDSDRETEGNVEKESSWDTWLTFISLENFFDDTGPLASVNLSFKICLAINRGEWETKYFDGELIAQMHT